MKAISSDSATSARPLQGIILMVVAMLTIPAVDGLAKYLSVDYSPLFLSWARYAVASVIVLPVAARIHGVHFLPTDRRTSHFWRTVFLVAAMTFYFLAVARIPLATAVSAYFVGPIITVVLSVVILKEQLTWQNTLSLGLGFAGSMIILQPTGSVDGGILLALGAGVFFAFYLITTRQATQVSDPLKTLAFQCVVGTLLLTPQAVFFWSTPTWDDLSFFVGLGLFSALSHMLSIVAFRFADASTLAPLVYVELVGAGFIGYFAFDETPTSSTIIGAGFIVVAGLILIQRRNPPRNVQPQPA